MTIGGEHASEVSGSAGCGGGDSLVVAQGSKGGDAGAGAAATNAHIERAASNGKRRAVGPLCALRGARAAQRSEAG